MLDFALLFGKGRRIDDHQVEPLAFGSQLCQQVKSIPRQQLMLGCGHRRQLAIEGKIALRRGERGLRRAASLGLRTTVYTVNDETRMRRLAALGVDGIFTDRPALLRATLLTRPEAKPLDG